MGALEYVNCDLCGIDNTELLYRVSECTGMYSEIFNLVRCKNCGLVYVNPRPIKEELYKYYSQENYYAYQNLENETFRNKIKDYLVEWAGGYRRRNNGFNYINRFITWVLKALTKNILIGVVPYKIKGELLDIGCGNSSFLKWHKNHGWQVKGVEVNKEAANLCKQKGIEVFNGELLDASFANETFDVVTLIQVLEHLPNPSDTLREIHRVLKRNGLLIIGVPNFGSFDRRVFNGEWGPLEIPRHLYHFNYITLKKILERNGFQIEDLLGKGFYMLGLKNLKYFNGQKHLDKLIVLLRISLIKPFLLLISRSRIEKFSPLISIYAKKLD